ncbi:DUF1592 domain-containing protein [Roseiconus lacunae]|uniref:DUF1592 domain-containing protein n=1 Tax=Roseiconus lacunae TaxID=2605694 RepID=A0ABT7PCC0_9BACT|nr:DUF1592 domain-containing protein [Roseiconus lacunae]MDM4014140.1 DUF1592 domain-containing protein [Roseiconus lacunae]
MKSRFIPDRSPVCRPYAALGLPYAALGLLLISFPLGAVCSAAEDVQSLTSFVNDHCMDCHDGPDGEGGFNAGSLNLDIFADAASEKDLHHWIRAFDRVEQGEMPPPEDVEVDSETRATFVKDLRTAIKNSQDRHHQSNGRVLSRRLTNDQLTATLGDLLSIDVPLARLMPEEPRVDGFRNIADAQSMSYYHLEDHLRVVDAALDAAFAKLRTADIPEVIDLPANRIANKRKGQRNRDPELREDAAVIWMSTMAFYGRISRTTVDEAGWYRITLEASSLNPPDDRNVWCSIRSGKCVSTAALMFWIGSIELTEKPQTFQFDAWIEKDHMLEIRPADNTLKKAKFRGGQVGFGEGEPQKVPGIAMHHLKLERIYPAGDTNQTRRALFGDLDVTWHPKKKQWQLQYASPDNPAGKAALVEQAKRFAARAFRRPIDEQSFAPYRQIIEAGWDAKQDPVDLLRQTYRAILCSPRLIYFTEPPGELDDHAIACRLSYLLTGSMPDEELRRAANKGQLRDNPDAIITHTRRLLDGRDFDTFVTDFGDQWLDLADIAFTEPDRRMFSDFDLIVQDAMLGETRRYLKTLISENRPASQLVDSDFTWLNDRLARYYDIDVEIGPTEWKRVDLRDHEYRGGLMTHGSILKVTANGTDTSPVVRGVWICDRLLGIPIPDPPENVPAIEPDVRGAKTIREMLAKHREDVSCASCHKRIDPPGFALEMFDAAGQWRENYLVRKSGKYRQGPNIDASYQMPDGRKFDSFVEFRELAASTSRRIAKNFAGQLLVYGTGTPITFSDRDHLESIATAAEDNQYGLRSLIEAVVTSQPFLNK